MGECVVRSGMTSSGSWIRTVSWSGADEGMTSERGWVGVSSCIYGVGWKSIRGREG